MKEFRIVSLIASATEIVCALGFEKYLVGRSHECDYPGSIKHLPACSQVKFKTAGTSLQIDRAVKDILEKSLSVYRVDVDRLAQLGPTHIITQAHCEVCAVSLKDVEEAACALISSKPKVISLEPNSLKDVFAGIRQVAASLDGVAEGEALVEALTKRMSEIETRAKSVSVRPKVAFIEWIEPLMSGGNWMPELIAMAGGLNLFGVAGAHSPPMTFNDLIAGDPDVIVISPCGFDNARTLQETHLLSEREGWQSLPAVRNDRVFVADGNQFFNRPGPRLVDSLEILSEILHPQLFQFGHGGSSYLTLSQAEKVRG